jgi:hypothetical protein
MKSAFKQQQEEIEELNKYEVMRVPMEVVDKGTLLQSRFEC